jgi:hypothetical protein
MARHDSSYPRVSTREQTYINSQQQNSIQSETIFYLCDACFWCATYLGKFMLPLKIDVPYVRIQNFPTFLYYPNESFTFDYNHKCGAELGFEPREKR